LLQKPAGVMEHGGGERLPLGGFAYNLLKQWLADSAPEPKANDPAVSRLEIFPIKRVMVPGEQQQLGIRAVWSDGRIEDVTATTQFDSLNPAIATVSPTGIVAAKDKGETSIMVRFGGQATVMQVSLPYANQPASD